MDNLIEDRQDWHGKELEFYKPCPHKLREPQLDTQSMEYVYVCLDCGQQVI